MQTTTTKSNPFFELYLTSFLTCFRELPPSADFIITGIPVLNNISCEIKV